MADLLKLLSLLLFLFVLARISYNFIVIASSMACAFNGYIVEACPLNYTLSQANSDAVNSTTALLEAVNSFVLLTLLLFWEKFHTRKFGYAIFLVGHFWVWFALGIIHSAADLFTDLVHTGTYKDFLGIATVFEIITTTLFASAINFVDRKNHACLDW